MSYTLSSIMLDIQIRLGLAREGEYGKANNGLETDIDEYI